MAIVTVGIDLAKNVLAVHGVEAAGRAVLAPGREFQAAGVRRR